MENQFKSSTLAKRRKSKTNKTKQSRTKKQLRKQQQQKTHTIINRSPTHIIMVFCQIIRFEIITLNWVLYLRPSWTWRVDPYQTFSIRWWLVDFHPDVITCFDVASIPARKMICATAIAMTRLSLIWHCSCLRSLWWSSTQKMLIYIEKNTLCFISGPIMIVENLLTSKPDKREQSKSHP